MCLCFSNVKKSMALDVFMICKIEVEQQYERTIKIVRFDHECEYYKRYGGWNKLRGPFFNYLQDCRIIAQYPMPCTL